MSVRYGEVKLAVPKGFKELLEDLSREVLREQPKDIPKFAAEFFRRLLSRRGGEEPAIRPYQPPPPTPASQKKEEPRAVAAAAAPPPPQPSVPSNEITEEEKKALLEDKDADKAATLIQARFRGYQSRKSLESEASVSQQKVAAAEYEQDAAVADTTQVAESVGSFKDELQVASQEVKEKHSLQGDVEAAEADSALPIEQASAAEYDHRDSIGGILSEVDVYAKASAALVEENGKTASALDFGEEQLMASVSQEIVRKDSLKQGEAEVLAAASDVPLEQDYGQERSESASDLENELLMASQQMVGEDEVERESAIRYFHRDSTDGQAMDADGRAYASTVKLEERSESASDLENEQLMASQQIVGEHEIEQESSVKYGHRDSIGGQAMDADGRAYASTVKLEERGKSGLDLENEQLMASQQIVGEHEIEQESSVKYGHRDSIGGQAMDADGRAYASTVKLKERGKSGLDLENELLMASQQMVGEHEIEQESSVKYGHRDSIGGQAMDADGRAYASTVKLKETGGSALGPEDEQLMASQEIIRKNTLEAEEVASAALLQQESTVEYGRRDSIDGQAKEADSYGYAFDAEAVMGAKDEQQIPSEETMMREQSPLVDEEFEEAISEVPLGQESSADYELAASDEQQLGAATSQMDRQLEEEGFSFANRSEMQEATSKAIAMIASKTVENTKSSLASSDEHTLKAEESDQQMTLDELQRNSDLDVEADIKVTEKASIVEVTEEDLKEEEPSKPEVAAAESEAPFASEEQLADIQEEQPTAEEEQEDTTVPEPAEVLEVEPIESESKADVAPAETEMEIAEPAVEMAESETVVAEIPKPDAAAEETEAEPQIAESAADFEAAPEVMESDADFGQNIESEVKMELAETTEQLTDNAAEEEPIAAEEAPQVSEAPEETQKDTPATEDAPAAEEVPSTEDIPAAEEVPSTEDVPAPEKVPSTEDVPAPEEIPSTEDVSAPEKVPSTEDAPALEEVSSAEDVLAPEKVPSTEDAPALEEVPSTEDAPAAEKVPSTEDAPTLEEVPSTEDVPAPEKVPSTEDALALEEVPSTEDVPAPEKVPSTEDALALEEVPSTEDVPAPEKVPSTEDALALEEVPSIEDAPALEELPSTENVPASEEDPFFDDIGGANAGPAEDKLPTEEQPEAPSAVEEDAAPPAKDVPIEPEES